MSDIRPDSAGRSISIWDAWTRLFHWSLVIAVSFLIFSGKTGELFFDWHRYAGEFVLALMVFRILWGIVGSSNVRFTRLFRNPLEATRHLMDVARRKAPPEREHNAAGAWAVLVMIAMITVQATTGLFIADEEELLEGALYGSLASSTSDWLYSIHHTNGELITAVVVVHVVMIAVYYLYAGINLITPMITGRMNWPAEFEVPPLHIQKFWIGLVCAFIALAIVGLTTGWYG